MPVATVAGAGTILSPPLCPEARCRDWRSGGPVPEGFEVQERVSRSRVYGGAGVAAAFWLLPPSLLLLVGFAPSEVAPAFVPIAGSFLAIESLDANDTNTGVLASFGVLQIAGVVLSISGVAFKEKRLVKRLTPWGQGRGPSIRFVPSVAPDHAGVGLQGEF
ncbi:MAG: hypothetical protein AAF715_12460 [Myxococcota bacterium]